MKEDNPSEEKRLFPMTYQLTKSKVKILFPLSPPRITTAGSPQNAASESKDSTFTFFLHDFISKELQNSLPNRSATTEEVAKALDKNVPFSQKEFPLYLHCSNFIKPKPEISRLISFPMSSIFSLCKFFTLTEGPNMRVHTNP